MFLAMTVLKTRLRNRMSPANDLIVALSSAKPRFKNMISSKQAQISIKLLILFLKILLITVHIYIYIYICIQIQSELFISFAVACHNYSTDFTGK
jgi:hypothetical protein